MASSSWNRHKEPMGRRHMEDGRRWGPWAVGRPPWSAGLALWPTDLSFGWVTDTWAPHAGKSGCQVSSLCMAAMWAL